MLMGRDDVARALARRNVDQAGLGDTDVAMLSYVVKLTRDPHEISEADIDRLRGVGFDDTAIHDICHVASYYNYVNRMADGLGVELEPVWTDQMLVLSRSEFDGQSRRREEVKSE